MTSLPHKCSWGLPCWATHPVNNRMPNPMGVTASQHPWAAPLPVLQHHPALHPAHPTSAAAKISQVFQIQRFFFTPEICLRKNAGKLQSRETHLKAPGIVCRSKQPISWLQEPGYAQWRSSGDNLPSTSSAQTSETLSVPGEIIKETKERKGGMQSACFQLRKKKPCIFRERGGNSCVHTST